MIIKISGLSDGVHSFEFEGEAKSLGLKEPFKDSYKLEIELEKSIKQIIVTGDFKGEGDFVCDRCTEEYQKEIHTIFKHIYLIGEKHDDKYDEEVTYLSFDADKIDIINEVVDYAKLAVPMKNLCNEDCKGLCPICGKNLNVEQCNCKLEKIDDRWSPLLKLKEKK